LRSEGLWHLVPGEITTVRPKKSWRFKGYTYLAAQVESSRLDIAALGLVPLRLEPMDVWDPLQEYWGEPDDPLEPWAAKLVAEGPRPCFEMEQVIPGYTLEELVDDDPIVEASELAAGGDHRRARRILAELLMLDLRCLDAHAHLGNFLIDHWPVDALRHYTVGVGIGEQALGAGFDGVLLWGMIDNRPFLRCLHGLGLALWALKRNTEALAVFERMLRLNPSDNQGVRFMLGPVADGKSREQFNDG
jgi:hypothetical protein